MGPAKSTRHTVTHTLSDGITKLTTIPVAYVGDDYPEHLPQGYVPVQTTMSVAFENTSAFPISGPTAIEEWRSIYPKGFGFVRLGNESRLLCVAMFHELHCIEKMRIFLDNPWNKAVAFPHQQHCMNYLRQLFLCKADMTLEPIEIEDSSSPVDLAMKSGMGVVRSCGDWKRLYENVGANYEGWKASWNITSPWETNLTTGHEGSMGSKANV